MKKCFYFTVCGLWSQEPIPETLKPAPEKNIILNIQSINIHPDFVPGQVHCSKNCHSLKALGHPMDRASLALYGEIYLGLEGQDKINYNHNTSYNQYYSINLKPKGKTIAPIDMAHIKCRKSNTEIYTDICSWKRSGDLRNPCFC